MLKCVQSSRLFKDLGLLFFGRFVSVLLFVVGNLLFIHLGSNHPLAV